MYFYSLFAYDTCSYKKIATEFGHWKFTFFPRSANSGVSHWFNPATFSSFRFDIILDTLGNTTASFNRGLLAPSKGALYVTLVNQMMYNFDTYGMLAGGLKSAVHVAWQAMAVSIRLHFRKANAILAIYYRLDTGPGYLTPPPPPICWSSLETSSNLFTWHLVVAIEAGSTHSTGMLSCFSTIPQEVHMTNHRLVQLSKNAGKALQSHIQSQTSHQ